MYTAKSDENGSRLRFEDHYGDWFDIFPDLQVVTPYGVYAAEDLIISLEGFVDIAHDNVPGWALSFEDVQVLQAFVNDHSVGMSLGQKMAQARKPEGRKDDQDKPNPFEYSPPSPPSCWPVCVARPSEKIVWLNLLGTLPVYNRTLGIFDAMEYGAKKYARDNWRLVENGLERYQQAALRHAWYEQFYPEDAETGIDSESGLHHYSLAAASISMVLEFLSISTLLEFLKDET